MIVVSFVFPINLTLLAIYDSLLRQGNYIGLELVSINYLSETGLSDAVSYITHVQNYIFMRMYYDQLQLYVLDSAPATRKAVTIFNCDATMGTALTSCFNLRHRNVQSDVTMLTKQTEF